jgi:hypothetical protein
LLCRLEERGQELEAAQGQATQAKGLLERTLKEKETLQKRLGALSRDTAQVGGGKPMTSPR